MMSPIENSESLRVGTIDFISPDEIKVLLDIEVPNDVTLNTGVPRSFPRINGYVLFSCENGYLVGQINWITIERSQYPKRRGIQDFGIIDLPFPLRIISINPLGVLRYSKQSTTGKIEYEFSRGIDIFPTVGDPAYLPTEEQLRAIIENGENRRVQIGTSPLCGNAVVSVDPDKLFGRHVAVLGNTGSGKSCSVAGLIRWSIEAAGEKSNSRFIILDPNGEYSDCFSDFKNVNRFAVEPDNEKGIKQLKVPLWLWNTDEWIAFTQAGGKAQKPTLVQALRTVREGLSHIDFGEEYKTKNFLKTIYQITELEIKNGNPWGGFRKAKSFLELLEKWNESIVENNSFSQVENDAIGNLKSQIDLLKKQRTGTYVNYNFSTVEANNVKDLINNAYIAFGGSEKDFLPTDENIPLPFTGEMFLSSIESNAALMGTSDYVETMRMRVQTLLSDKHLQPVICNKEEYTLENWLRDYICPDTEDSSAITIIDLSLLPSEMTHIIASVIARMTLESLQRFRKNNNGKTLPTTIVMEEAHTFIKRYNDDTETYSASSTCAKIFEKIAREGRKFGLGLVLSSQRPSELSPTVLSQCNTFLLHRISNDRDQELVHRLVPDNLRGLLRDLPSLPSRNAILLGWATELPILVQMKTLPEEHRPKSNDPEYWKYWTETKETVNWQEIANDWQDKVTEESIDNTENTDE